MIQLVSLYGEHGKKQPMFTPRFGKTHTFPFMDLAGGVENICAPLVLNSDRASRCAA